MASLSRVVLGTGPVTFGAAGSMTYVTANAFDAATDANEWIVQAEEAATITHIGIKALARVGTPPTFRVSLQGVTGVPLVPDGTVLGGGSPASGTYTPPASSAWNNTWQWIALTNSYTCTRGEVFAIVDDYSSGSIDASNTLSRHNGLNGFQGRVGFPLAITNNAGVRSRDSQLPIFGYKSATKSYGLPFSAPVTTSYSSDSSPNEYALAFSLPLGSVTKYQIMGARLRMVTPAASKNFSVNLYEGTTLLQTTGTLSSDLFRIAATDSYVEVYFTDTTLAELVPETVYRVSLLSLSTTSNIALGYFQFNDAQDAAINGDGRYYLSTRAGGAWTDFTTRRPLVDLILASTTGPNTTIYLP
jgi:hypothetical protein